MVFFYLPSLPEGKAGTVPVKWTLVNGVYERRPHFRRQSVCGIRLGFLQLGSHFNKQEGLVEIQNKLIGVYFSEKCLDLGFFWSVTEISLQPFGRNLAKNRSKDYTVH